LHSFISFPAFANPYKIIKKNSISWWRYPFYMGFTSQLNKNIGQNKFVMKNDKFIEGVIT